MALLFAAIGGLVMGAVGNTATGVISFVVLWISIGAFEEMDAQINSLRRYIAMLEAEKEMLLKR